MTLPCISTPLAETRTSLSKEAQSFRTSIPVVLAFPYILPLTWCLYNWRYGPLQIEPASTVINYGQSIFEGLKASRLEDGSIACFRPRMNAARLQEGCDGYVMPPPSTEVRGNIQSHRICLVGHLIFCCIIGLHWCHGPGRPSECSICATDRHWWLVLHATGCIWVWSWSRCWTVVQVYICDIWLPSRRILQVNCRKYSRYFTDYCPTPGPRSATGGWTHQG